jgi:cytoskeletal protein CcmA (bactofilin family)
MAELNGEYPTVIGTDAKFKGELAFEKGVRIEGSFEGQIRSKGTLHVAEGAKVSATVEAMNVKIEGECNGNIVVSEKLQLLATAKMEGDLKTNRLEIADGAIFVGNVVVGQTAAGTSQPRRAPSPGGAAPQPAVPAHDPSQAQPKSPPHAAPRPRPQDTRIPASNP